MTAADPPGPSAPDDDARLPAVGDGSVEEPYDPTGLGLARTVAQSVGRPRRRRRSPPRVGSSGSDPVSSGAHPDDRDPKPLGSALDRLVESKGWSTEVTVHQLLGRWESLVGATNAAHSHPESYSDRVLTVRAESSVWASSLRAVAPQLVAILNERLGDGTVTRVQVLGPQGPSWKKGRLSVRDGRGPRDTYG